MAAGNMALAIHPHGNTVITISRIVNASLPKPRKVDRARRLRLVASVAGLGIAAVLVSPSGYGALNFAAWTSSAQPAEMMQHPPGFADLVAKAKPAVVSVRN
jgi:serine protease Do